MKKRILVTGGAGFIGSHLCERLINEGNKVDAMLKVVETSDNVYMPINIGNPEEYNILELARQIVELTNTESKIIFKPLPKDDPQKRCPDVLLAKKVLDWQPRVLLKEGLEKTIRYFRNKNSMSFS